MCHIIFDIETEGFQRKAQLVAGGSMTEAPPTTTFESVLSHETVRITHTIPTLNDCQMKAADIMNAYVTTPCLEKIWTVLDPEFRKNTL